MQSVTNILVSECAWQIMVTMKCFKAHRAHQSHSKAKIEHQQSSSGMWKTETQKNLWCHWRVNSLWFSSYEREPNGGCIHWTKCILIMCSRRQVNVAVLHLIRAIVHHRTRARPPHHLNTNKWWLCALCYFCCISMTKHKRIVYAKWNSPANISTASKSENMQMKLKAKLFETLACLVSRVSWTAFNFVDIAIFGCVAIEFQIQ